MVSVKENAMTCAKESVEALIKKLKSYFVNFFASINVSSNARAWSMKSVFVE